MYEKSNLADFGQKRLESVNFFDKFKIMDIQTVLFRMD